MKKFNLVMTMAFAVTIAFVMYFLIINYFVDDYIMNYTDIGRSIALFDFYENYEDIEKDIFYLGPSSFKEDIDAGLMDKINGYSNFNLGNPASTPLRRYIEVDHIIKADPEIVVLGIGPMSLSGKWLFPDDHYALISNKIKIDNSFGFYDDYPINLNRLQLLLYKRKFFGNSLFKILERKLLYYGEYNKNFKSENILKQVKEDFDSKFIEEINSREKFDEFEVPSEENYERIAFESIIKKLNENRIKVLIVKIPINPLLLEKIPEEYMKNYDEFLFGVSNKHNVKILDYTKIYEENYFYDGLHLNRFGRKTFSEELSMDVIKNAV